MKINIHSIRDHGTDISLNCQDDWIRTVLTQAFPSENPIQNSFSGYIHIDRFNDDLDFKGSVSLVLQPLCGRCGERFDHPLSVAIVMHMVPSQGDSEEDDHINFAYHNGVDIDLAELLAEQLIFAIPFTFLCSENCKGLCVTCGTNLNNEKCSCTGKPIDPRWAVLQNFNQKNPLNN